MIVVIALERHQSIYSGEQVSIWYAPISFFSIDF